MQNEQINSFVENIILKIKERTKIEEEKTELETVAQEMQDTLAFATKQLSIQKKRFAPILYKKLPFIQFQVK